jgi:hypothetical protein
LREEISLDDRKYFDPRFLEVLEVLLCLVQCGAGMVLEVLQDELVVGFVLFFINLSKRALRGTFLQGIYTATFFEHRHQGSAV